MRRILLLMVTFAILVFPRTAAAEQALPAFADAAGRSIQLVANLGIMIGTGQDGPGLSIFAPADNASRAQLAVVLQRCFQLDYGDKRFIKQPVASDYYQDVRDDAWYANGLVMCAVNDIFPSGGNFMPDRPVTRLEVAQALYISFQAKHISIPMIMLMPVFEDTNHLSQAEMNAVVFVNNTGIMPGEDGFFRPGELMNRSQLAAVLSRCVDLVALGENDNGREYRIQSGQTMVIALPGNPTTGYYWSLKEAGDARLITPVVDFYLADETDTPLLVGQGGKQYWQFKALQPGTTQLQLVYSRPWESVAPIKVFTLPVTVL